MNFLKWIVGGTKTVDDVFDKDKGLLAKAGGWIGNLNYTDQEKAVATQEMITSVQKFVVASLDENTDRSKARREIAVFFIKFYTLMLFMCGMTYPFNEAWSLMWFQLATSLAAGSLVTAITVFFFGSYAMARNNETKK